MEVMTVCHPSQLLLFPKPGSKHITWLLLFVRITLRFCCTAAAFAFTTPACINLSKLTSTC